jgi:hypothetical protein
MNRIKYITKSNKPPKILIITPLKMGDKVSKITKKTIKRNKTPFVWISYMGNNNPAENTRIAYNQYKRNNEIPPYVIKIDNDITASRKMLDKMYQTLDTSKFKSNGIYAYAYCGFEFQGVINTKFPLKNFDHFALIRQNYISSNSLINTQLLDKIGGFVTNDKGFRLLDWALWLKFLNKGYIGIPVDNAYFIAYASKNSISARSTNDYVQKYQWVSKNFIEPLKKQLNSDS